MGVTWDDSADKQMLLCMIFTNSPSITNYEQIAKMMGEAYTVESIRSRFKKVKNMAKEQFGEPGDLAAGGASGGAALKTTPKRGGKKASAESATKSTGKRRAKSNAVGKADADANEQDDEETPTKKVKSELDDEAEGDLVSS